MADGSTGARPNTRSRRQQNEQDLRHVLNTIEITADKIDQIIVKQGVRSLQNIDALTDDEFAELKTKISLRAIAILKRFKRWIKEYWADHLGMWPKSWQDQFTEDIWDN